MAKTLDCAALHPGYGLGPALAAGLADTLYGIVNRGEAQVVWCGREHLRHEQRADVSPLPLLLSQHIRMGPLTLEETRELAAQAQRFGARIGRGFAETLHDMTDGHPYRLQYYLHWVLANGGEATPESLRRVHSTDTIEILNEILSDDTLPSPPRGAAAGQPSVFVSYSHEDEEEKRQLVTHLRVLEGSGIAVTWVDDLLRPGSDWEQEILDRIDSASVAVLLISAPFLKPRGFILRTELPRILERQAQGRLQVVPVVVRDCDWQSSRQISSLALMPKNGRPLWRTGVTRPDEALTEVARQVRRLLRPEAETL